MCNKCAPPNVKTTFIIALLHLLVFGLLLTVPVTNETSITISEVQHWTFHQCLVFVSTETLSINKKSAVHIGNNVPSYCTIHNNFRIKVNSISALTKSLLKTAAAFEPDTSCPHFTYMYAKVSVKCGT